MLSVTNLQLPPESGETELRDKLCKLLHIKEEDLLDVRVVKRAIDARHKDRLHLVYTVNVRVADEERALRRGDPGRIKRLEKAPYRFPQPTRGDGIRPVIVGLGPAGLFAALYLAEHGIPSIVLERGAPVERRTEDVARFWRTGELNGESNVQFGEGGAGTFSDGKLTTGTHDGRISAVLDTLVRFGAPEDVTWSFRPHVGTDLLRGVVRGIRGRLEELGCDVRFDSRMETLTPRPDGRHRLTVRGPEGEYTLETDAVVLAIGHSARDTFAALRRAGLPMEQKPFAVGVRIEHRQEAVGMAQYGALWDKLPPSDYRLSCHLPDGRSAFSFCVCPGGQVVASASEPGHLVTNGMSLRARDGENCNGGFLVGVGPGDFGGDDPLAGVEFQRRWERAAFQAGGGDYRAPAQRVEDFLAHRESRGPGGILPTYRPGVAWGDLHGCLPEAVARTLEAALPILGRKMRGFDAPDAVLTGIETRSSSPVRVLREADLQSAVKGVYPCGEGCGYAGGIVSAAVDGIRIAEAIATGK